MKFTSWTVLAVMKLSLILLKFSTFSGGFHIFIGKTNPNQIFLINMETHRSKKNNFSMLERKRTLTSNNLPLMKNVFQVFFG
jgi:hypothetical protein